MEHKLSVNRDFGVEIENVFFLFLEYCRMGRHVRRLGNHFSFLFWLWLCMVVVDEKKRKSIIMFLFHVPRPLWIMKLIFREQKKFRFFFYKNNRYWVSLQSWKLEKKLLSSATKRVSRLAWNFWDTHKSIANYMLTEMMSFSHQRMLNSLVHCIKFPFIIYCCCDSRVFMWRRRSHFRMCLANGAVNWRKIFPSIHFFFLSLLNFHYFFFRFYFAILSHLHTYTLYLCHYIVRHSFIQSF